MNPLRGEAPLSGTDYVLRYTIGTMAAIEGEIGGEYNFLARVGEWERGGVPRAQELLLITRRGLEAKHGLLAPDEVSEAIAKAGGIIPVVRMVLGAVESAFGPAGPEDAGKNRASPTG